MKPKRNTKAESSKKYWEAIDRIVDRTKKSKKKRILIGDPWTDSLRDLSPTLLRDDLE